MRKWKRERELMVLCKDQQEHIQKLQGALTSVMASPNSAAAVAPITYTTTATADSGWIYDMSPWRKKLADRESADREMFEGVVEALGLI